MSSLELSFGKKFSAVFLENPFIRKVLIAETAFFTDFMLVRSDLHCVLETGHKRFFSKKKNCQMQITMKKVSLNFCSNKWEVCRQGKLEIKSQYSNVDSEMLVSVLGGIIIQKLNLAAVSSGDKFLFCFK